jgi:tRNA G10  N-methylase Trm11
MSEKSEFAMLITDKVEPREPLRSCTNVRKEWFRGRGLFFLFTKHLRVTNVQFTELLGLLRMHMREKKSAEPAASLIFTTSEEFDHLLVEVIEPFLDRNNTELGKVLADLYFDVFARTVIVDPYYGSCNVFVPPTLRLDLAAIAGEAAYLHSCGFSVFVRNMVKAEPQLLHDKLSQHFLVHPPQSGKRIRFLIYADEDFTARDRRNAELLRNGLDDAKIHVEKAWFRTQRLVDVVNDLRSTMKDELVIDHSRDYVADLAAGQADETVDSTRTLWLVQDRAVGTPCEQPGDERYYICYDQLYRSRNATHIFDENKPAWRDHTTMPPSLAGALLNIVRPRENKPIKVVDPFVGTGTSLLEALRFPDITFNGSDSDPSSDRLVEDNVDFFWLNDQQVDETLGGFFEVKSELEEHGSTGFANTRVYSIAKELFSTAEFAHHARTSEKLALRKDQLPKDRMERLLAYVALRASKRNSARFARSVEPSNDDWLVAFEEELLVLTTQLQEMKKLRELEWLSSDGELAAMIAHEHYGRGNARVALLKDNYSIGCVPEVQMKRDRAEVSQRYCLKVGPGKGDVTHLEQDAFDVVIGDPPYGFNSPEDAKRLAELYREFASAALRSLRDGGHLLLCLPERSHSGKYSPAFTHRSLVVQQLLLLAGQAERQLVFPHDRVRGAERLYESEYYWESERALRRSILHVQVRHAAKEP